MGRGHSQASGYAPTGRSETGADFLRTDPHSACGQTTNSCTPRVSIRAWRPQLLQTTSGPGVFSLVTAGMLLEQSSATPGRRRYTSGLCTSTSPTRRDLPPTGELPSPERASIFAVTAVSSSFFGETTRGAAPRLVAAGPRASDATRSVPRRDVEESLRGCRAGQSSSAAP